MSRILFSLLLAGCAQPIVWDASGTQFKTDDYGCTKDAMYMPNVVPVDEDTTGFAKGFADARNQRGPQLNEDLYVQCMEAKGYESEN